MARNGSGTYSLPSGNPVTTGTTISSTVQNNTMSDIAVALTQSLAKDGQTTPTANLPMGGYKHTGAAAGSARTDYATISNLQDGTGIYVSTVGGTVDAITLTPSPAITAYTAGQTFSFIASGANTGAVTVNVSGLGAKDVTVNGTSRLYAGDIPSGATVLITYDGTRFQLIRNGSSSSFRKNAIINGDFQVWQEGTSFAAMASATYTADMWNYQKSGVMVHTGSQSSDVPTIAQAGRKIPYSLLIDCTTVDASIAASDYCLVRTYVEGYNFVNIAGVGLCHRFWHKHTKTGTYCVAYMNAGSDRTFVREYTQSVSDTWELATVLIDASPTAGTWNYTNGAGLYISFTLACGSTYQTTAGAWQTGAFFGTANQVNACDSTSNNFMLAGVQLEKGSAATEFDVRTYQQELIACQRYFWMIGDALAYTYFGLGCVAGTDQLLLNVQMPVTMRAVPVMTLGSGSSFIVNDTAVSAVSTTAALSGAVSNGPDLVLVSLTNFAGGPLTTGNSAFVYSNNFIATALKFSARL